MFKYPHKVQLSVTALLTLCLSIFIYLIGTYPLKMGVCQSTYERDGEIRCFDTLAEPLLLPLFLFLISLLLSLIPLLFLRVEVYRTWRKFALWYWGVGIFLLLIIPGGGGGGWAMSFPSPKDILTVLLPILFLIISYMLMLAKSQQLRKRK